MPSSPDYVRDYRQEARTARARGEIGGSDTPNAARKRARRLAIKKGMVKPHDGKDVHHKKPLSKGGSNKVSNLAVTNASKNRSFKRNSDGSIKGKG